ncbi:type III pantothenate kinase [Mycoplasmopsis mustelae]|uniref:Type III pantothenate kinase n=1 Tax=Mycoplasmopsis mustelae TaxID=171289 RepID=A0A4R7UCF3_9BACT|nr:type III pantothenate kinase [Mycoplasmopsis mustelae]TDV23568.1 type III pantothenate kinase [Mycoplasmopsis mustelae]
MLYLDLGNSLLKIGFFKNDNLIIKKINIKQLNQLFLKTEIQNLLHLNFHKAILSSVKPEMNIFFVEVFKKLKINLKIISILDFSADDLFFDSKINTSEIGSDILLTSYYIAQKYKSGIVVSLGTATVISKIYHKKLLGVIISPGIEKSLLALFSNTSQISKIELNYNISFNLATNTTDAVSLGIIKGNKLMINSFLKEINSENLKVFYTGGNLRYFKNENLTNIKEELVIQGLIEFSKNKKLF